MQSSRLDLCAHLHKTSCTGASSCLRCLPGQGSPAFCSGTGTQHLKRDTTCELPEVHYASEQALEGGKVTHLVVTGFLLDVLFLDVIHYSPSIPIASDPIVEPSGKKKLKWWPSDSPLCIFLVDYKESGSECVDRADTARKNYLHLEA